jgi:hypothetical protein
MEPGKTLLHEALALIAAHPAVQAASGGVGLLGKE